MELKEVRKRKSKMDGKAKFLLKFIMGIVTIYCIFAFINSSRKIDCKQHIGCESRNIMAETKPNVTCKRKDDRPWETTQIHHILFSMGGSIQTWNERKRYSDLWWIPNGTRGFVWLESPAPKNYSWPATSPPFRVSKDTSKFKYTNSDGDRSAIHLARMVNQSFELQLKDVRWFVFGDDDTVFYLENLLVVLRKYDHTQMHYIGGISESVQNNEYHSYDMAYGGGGYVVSYPLAKIIARNIDGCIDRYSSAYGSDLKVQGCISEVGIPLSIEPGFHQLDIKGDPYGFLAAHPVSPLVSLHHMETFEPIIPGMSRVGSLAKLQEGYRQDPGRMLQQSFCYLPSRNWTISVSWGYTVQIYPRSVTPQHLERKLLTFRTYAYGYRPFTVNTRPIGTFCDPPIIYFLQQASSPTSGHTLTKYRRSLEDIHRNCESPNYVAAFNVEYINVVSPILTQRYWHSAPRRQCCDARPDEKSHDTILVSIRSCKPFETVTPQF